MDAYNIQSYVVKSNKKTLLKLGLFNKILARIELILSATFLAIIFILLLINVLTRALNVPLYWVDEAAIMAMIWMALFAASASIQKRSSIAVTLIIDLIPTVATKYLIVLVDLIILLFFLTFFYLCWNWFDIINLYKLDWNVSKFSMESFNFLYEEPSMTLGINKFWFWLILPIFSLSSSIHSTINLFLSISTACNKGA